MARAASIRWVSLLTWATLFAVVYAVFRHASERLFVLGDTSHISSFWPPSGFALAVLVCARRQVRPALVLGCFAGSVGDLLVVGLSWPAAIGWGVAATLEPVVGAGLMLRFLPEPRALAHVLDVLGFVVLGAVVGPAVGGVVAASVSTYLFGGHWLADWLRWSVSSSLGVLLVGPLFLTIRAWRSRVWLRLGSRGAVLLEAAVLLALLAGVTWRLVVAPLSPPLTLLLASYATIPFFLWAALRFGVPGVSAAVATSGVIAGWYIAHGQGPFSQVVASSHLELVAVQAFLAVGSICGLVLGASLEERQRTAQRQSLLADASAMLGESLEAADGLKRVARRVVPELADACAIFLEQDGGKLEPVALVHANPSLERILPFQNGRPPVGDGAGSAPFTSLAVPLRCHDRVLGLLLLVSSSVTRRFEADDATLAEELARRCSLAVERSELHRDQQEAVRARDEFLSIVSHELKTPLTPLALQLDVMARKLRAGQPVDPKSVDKQRGALQRLVGLIGELLDSSRAAAGRLTVNLAPMSLGDLVRNTCEGFASQSARHSLTVEVPEDELWVKGDRSRLEQVLSNLLDNALKYSPLGGPVRVALRAEGDEARLAVADSGIGIPEDEQKRLFDRFFRGRNASSKSFAGLGLGLYISRDIVERHGGRIWAESTAGQGTTFHVALPLLRAPKRTSLEPSSPAAAPCP